MAREDADELKAAVGYHERGRELSDWLGALIQHVRQKLEEKKYEFMAIDAAPDEPNDMWGSSFDVKCLLELLTFTPEPADTTLVRLLLDRGANVDSEDKERLTPLHLTASDGYTGIVRLLLNHGADRDAEDKDGWTPLHLASSDDHAITVRLLLNYGASLNAKNQKGRTPLQVASTQGMGNVVEILIEHGAEEYDGL